MIYNVKVVFLCGPENSSKGEFQKYIYQYFCNMYKALISSLLIEGLRSGDSCFFSQIATIHFIIVCITLSYIIY